MSYSLFADLAVFVLAVLVGIEVISKVPVTLHTPLMSATNAIHGIVIVGVVSIAAEAAGTGSYLLTFVAAAFAAANVAGGYVVTDRMLAMFRPRKHTSAVTGQPDGTRHD